LDDRASFRVNFCILHLEEKENKNLRLSITFEKS